MMKFKTLCWVKEAWHDDMFLLHDAEKQVKLWVDGDWLEGDMREHSSVMEVIYNLIGAVVI